MKKSTRTISGVTPVAVMASPMGCPGQCIYCPTFSATPKSYTPGSPVVLRAREYNYDAREQVRLRLKTLSEMGHPTDKIELIVMGGTFLACPEEYQYQFIKDCFDALNGEESATLEEAKELNEKASHRCTGLCIETRPDWCGQEEINRMLDFGTTRVELGVQTLDNNIYQLVRRGHTVEDVVKATCLLKEHAFKVHYHWMPGLPGSNPEKDLDLFQQLFSDARFRPDGLKIYPTMVIEGTELARWYQEGRYQPYPDETMINLVAALKSVVPRYVRISRVLRDIPSAYVIGGLRDSLRQVVKERMRQLGTECQCIRCREYGHRARAGWETGEPQMVRMDYEASEGREVCLSFEDDRETLFALLRMRIQSKPVVRLGQKTGENLALIRELHVYGAEVPLKQQNPEKVHDKSSDTVLPAEAWHKGSGTGFLKGVQHRGLGRSLLAEAERIAREEFQASEMAVLCGVGAREYFRSELGYTLQADYMVKSLSDRSPF